MLKKQVCRRPQHGFALDDHTPLPCLKGFPRLASAFLYSPCVAEREAGSTEVRHLIQRFFGNSRERLLLSLLDNGDVTPDELKRLKELIAQAPDDLPAPQPSVPSQESAE